MSFEVREGDCITAMRAMPACSVDSVVCDPPYHLSFMSKAWDTVTPGESQREHERWATEALRVLKPGGHLLAFGGTRTYHRLVCAVEDAGFEIRDSIANVSTPRPVPPDLLREWIEWTERNAHAGLRLVGRGGDSVPGPVLLGTSLARSSADAIIAELASSETLRTDAASWRSALEPAGATTTGSSALVIIAGNSPASPDATSTNGSTAPDGALVWLSASTEHRTRAAEALRIWRGSSPSSRRAATDALCAALTDALKAITLSQSETFQSYDTTLRTVCVCATTATTTASTAASLIAFTADTLAQGGDATEADSSGPLLWIYGSGFPPSKSLDVSKAIDRAAGAEREVVGESPHSAERTADLGYHGNVPDEGSRLVTAPATPEAERWEGWGTALKPAHEPVVVARKPLGGTVAATVLEHGTGALNVDGCRVEHDGHGVWGNHGQHPENHQTEPGSEGTTMGTGWNEPGSTRNEAGRWPANVVLDEQVAGLLDEQTGDRPGFSGGGVRKQEGDLVAIGSGLHQDGEHSPYYGDSGGASRFFYCAKSSRGERNAGLEGFEEQAVFKGALPNNPKCEGCGCRRVESFGVPVCECDQPQWAPDRDELKRNVHPTVKPISLMRWLVRLVTPPGGTVLDPFAGSGSTGCAAVLEGFDFIGLEREPEYVELARARIGWWHKHRGDGEAAAILAAGEARDAVEATGQLDMFAVDVPERDRAGREGEASADRTYTDRGGSNFAMKPGRRR